MRAAGVWLILVLLWPIICVVAMSYGLWVKARDWIQEQGEGGRGIPVLANRPRRRGMMEEISGGMRQHNIMFPAPPSRPTFFFERRRRHAVCGHRPS